MDPKTTFLLHGIPGFFIELWTSSLASCEDKTGRYKPKRGLVE
jgi:hypothetical protein